MPILSRRPPVFRFPSSILHLLLCLFLFASVSYGVSPVRSFLHQNLLDDALRVCRQYEVLSTSEKDNLFACGWVYFRTGRLESAEKVLEKTRKYSSLPEFMLLQAMDKIKHERYEDAKAITESVARDFRGSAIGLTAQELSAEIYELQGKLDPAAFIYKQVVGDDDERGRAHWGLARYYLSHGDTGRARTNLEATARIWPRHVGSRFNLGVLAMADGDLPAAAKWFGECYKLDKSDAGVLEQLGLLFEKKGQISDAIRYWRKALDVKKDSQVAKEKLAMYVSSAVDALLENKQWEEALKELNSSGKAINDPQFLYKRGYAYRNLGKWDKAATDLLDYSHSNPNDPAGARELGICYLNLKLPEKAQEYFAKAATAEPTNGMNFAWLGYVLESRGQWDAARESWAKALELLKEPAEVQRARRRLAAVEARLAKHTDGDKKDNDEQ